MDSFLVSDFNEVDYKKFIRKQKHFFVYTRGKEILGFIFLYEKKDVEVNELKNLEVNKKILEDSEDDFLIIKQICVKKDYHGLGIGKLLYSYIFKYTNKDLYTVIVGKPINKVSEQLHISLDFTLIANVNEVDGYKRHIYKLSKENVLKKYDLDLALEQYKQAADVYKHEDTLNWSKLSSLLYITSGLVGFIGLLWSINNTPLNEFNIIISFIGLTASVAYFFTIKSGLYYLSHRKHCLFDIEAIIIKFSGEKIFIPKLDFEKNCINHTQQKS